MAGTYARNAEVVILGGGPAGYMAAIRAGQLGKKVVLVERSELGGECLNRGCIPSKALIHASQLYHALRTEGPEVGVLASGLSVDLPATMKWKEAVVAKERLGVATLLKSAGVTVLPGEGRFVGPKAVDVRAPDGGHERIDFGAAVIATGAVPTVLPGFETDAGRVLNAWELLSMRDLPRSMLVLGGGVSGCELGEWLARLGVQVTIVELLPQLLPGLDADLSRELTAAFGRLGIEVRTATKASRLDRAGSTLGLEVDGPGGHERLEADRLFVTIGKRPATQELGLEDAGVAFDAKTGFIGVDAQMRTNVPTIYAAGDVARPPMLAHKSYREGIVAAEAIAGRSTRFDFRTVPSVVFTDPELSSVGLSKAAAEKAGHAAREVRFPFAALGRAHASHATSGWLKLVGDDRTGLLLGVHAAGTSVGEFAAEAAHALEMGSTVRDVALTIHPHPTFSEALQEAALLWLDEPMHVARRPGPAGGH